MKSVFKALPDKAYLSGINLPGTHDSCTAYCTMPNMSRCQSMTVKEQLNAGVRLFDIRLGRKSEEFFLVHSLATCFSDAENRNVLYFDEVLDIFRAFLKENPEEILVISVKQDRGIMSRGFFPKFYSKYIKGNESEWYLKNENPTLAECRGKMVLMRRCKVWKGFLRSKEAGLDFSEWKDQDGKKKTKPLPVILNEETVATVQDRYGLPAEMKWKECIYPFFEKSSESIGEKGFAVSFLSTAHRQAGKTIFESAEKVNAEFLKYELKKDAPSGWMLFDFPSEELLDKVRESNFEIYKESLK
ncbi:MAG: hypothetical protein IJN68_02095 [Clostridia bacterium]|nr:hypothetical protein [Clostridia bacterium]